MKKLLLSVLLAVGLVVNAQEFKFGPKVGLNISSVNVNGESTDFTSSRTSFHIGGMAEIKLSDKFALQPELLYSSQGAKEKVIGDYARTLKTDYLNIPIIAKYFIIDGLALEFGPQIGFLTSANKSEEVSSGSIQRDVKYDYKSADFGLNFGTSYTLDFGLNIGVRYNLGLTDIEKREIGDNATTKSGVFQVSVGYFF